MKSVFQSEKVCFITGSTEGLEEHHIIFGHGRRELSEEYGYKVWLRYELHNDKKFSVHKNPKFDLELKQMAQLHFEMHHGTRDEFTKIFGMNYFEKKESKL